VPGVVVVSVGNLAVGGTGKTPVAAWVAARLSAAGVPTALLTGSHGSDEARLHERWNPSVPVLVDRERVGAAARARAEGARAVVLDDGFQHFGLARDLDIVLLSGDDRFPGAVLPGGPYRERPEALARADVVVVTWRGADETRARAVSEAAARYAPDALMAGLHLRPASLRSLDDWSAPEDGEEPSDGRRAPVGAALAVCGVARPETFRTAVEARVGGPVELVAFADHHAFGPGDAARIAARAGDRPVVVTEKDAVKLLEHRARLPAVYVLVERVGWAWGERALSARLGATAAEVAAP